MAYCQMCADKEVEISTLRSRAEKAEEDMEIMKSIHHADSPCGHPSQYAVTTDGGRTITCLQCRAEKAEGMLKATEKDLIAVTNDRDKAEAALCRAREVLCHFAHVYNVPPREEEDLFAALSSTAPCPHEE